MSFVPRPSRALAPPEATLGGFGRAVIGIAIGLVLRLWVTTWRVRWIGSRVGARPRVLCFWHGRQMPLLCYAGRRGAVVMVSLSRDGSLQASILGSLGMRVVRGSSSRGGARGLLAFTRALREGCEGVFAVDGPRGPERRAKAGALHAARLAGVELLPLGVAAHPAWALDARWERFLVPLPFARVVVVEGLVVGAAATEEGRRTLDSSLEAAERAAEALLQEWRGVTFPERLA